MPAPVTPEEVRRLAELAGLSFPEEDLAPVAQALTAHNEFVRDLLAEDVSDVDPAVTFDPTWR